MYLFSIDDIIWIVFKHSMCCHHKLYLFVMMIYFVRDYFSKPVQYHHVVFTWGHTSQDYHCKQSLVQRNKLKNPKWPRFLWKYFKQSSPFCNKVNNSGIPLALKRQRRPSRRYWIQLYSVQINWFHPEYHF